MAALVSKALTFLPYTPLLFLIYFVTTRTLTWYRLRHFPGPFLGKFSYAFMAKTAWSGKMNLIYTDVTRRYGTLPSPYAYPPFLLFSPSHQSP